jgi:hypothetical protein
VLVVLVSGFWFLASGFWLLASGFRLLISDFSLPSRSHLPRHCFPIITLFPLRSTSPTPLPAPGPRADIRTRPRSSIGRPRAPLPPTPPPLPPRTHTHRGHLRPPPRPLPTAPPPRPWGFSVRAAREARDVVALIGTGAAVSGWCAGKTVPVTFSTQRRGPSERSVCRPPDDDHEALDDPGRPRGSRPDASRRDEDQQEPRPRFHVVVSLYFFLDRRIDSQ